MLLFFSRVSNMEPENRKPCFIWFRVKFVRNTPIDWQKVMHIWKNDLKGRYCLEDLFMQYTIPSGTTIKVLAIEPSNMTI